ncbi:trace amine-associated receptor 4-like [Engraulis encrasicolus]|uniref:trace amine-associated receptor 4-like n=1 Tax=Engraulis encrasicolus TaxID=184585 RepID=UPI002FD5E7BF
MNISQLSADLQFCYEGLNGSCARLTYPLAMRLPFYLFFLSTILLIAGGNLLVMCTIALFPKLRTPTNMLMVSMALADLLLGLLVMPPAMVKFLERCWYFGDALCQLHTCVDITLCNASVLHLTCISIDRFYAVNRPLQYGKNMTRRVALAMLSLSWAMSAAFGAAVIYSPPEAKHHDDGDDADAGHTRCVGECSGLHEKEAGVSYFFIFYFVPLTVMVTLYLRIFAIAIRQAQTIQVSTTTKQSSKGGSKGKGKTQQMSWVDYKATKTLGAVIGVFLCCWTPFFLCNIIDPVVDHSIPEMLYQILMWVAYLNSLFNPIIYALSYSWFRKTAVILLKIRF